MPHDTFGAHERNVRLSEMKCKFYLVSVGQNSHRRTKTEYAGSSMPGPIVVLGSNPVRLGEDTLVESNGATFCDIEALLASKPRAAVITSGDKAGFFRASLCLERGVSRVVLRRDIFDEAWEHELAARAVTFGAELYVHDDQRGYTRVKPGARLAIGVPDVVAWAHDSLGFVVETQWAEQARTTSPLEMDADIEGLPSNLEEVAFAHGDKPVLYLVVPARDVETLQSKYAGATVVRREIPLTVESATGRRMYESNAGESKTHVFLSNDAKLARRAAQLWDEGSSRNAVAIGELLGYPSCCVAAFVALGERGNNAALTYVTAARSRALAVPFHAALNSTVRHVLPCTPCSFGCPRAITLAARVLDVLPKDVSVALRRALARPVLYFDEARAIVFEGANVKGQIIEYESARFLSAPAPLDPNEELSQRRLFGALFAAPGALIVKDDVLEVFTGAIVRRIKRAGAKLGIVLPFKNTQ